MLQVLAVLGVYVTGPSCTVCVCYRSWLYWVCMLQVLAVPGVSWSRQWASEAEETGQVYWLWEGLPWDWVTWHRGEGDCLVDLVRAELTQLYTSTLCWHLPSVTRLWQRKITFTMLSCIDQTWLPLWDLTVHCRHWPWTKHGSLSETSLCTVDTDHRPNMAPSLRPHCVL